jgi:Icc-related predicted phosphoesterase
MKLLLFSDLHADRHAAERLLKMSRKVDVVIGAGDFGNQRRQVADCVDILEQITCPCVVVPGNNESYDELLTAFVTWDTVRILHGNGVTIEGVHFYGVGGGIPVTPFGDWSYDFDEEEAAEMLRDCPAHGVLITHSPAKDLLDLDGRGAHRGSTAIRAAIETKQPKLAVCGHIHASGGQSLTFGSSLIVNAGPGGIIVEV